MAILHSGEIEKYYRVICIYPLDIGAAVEDTGFMKMFDVQPWLDIERTPSGRLDTWAGLLGLVRGVVRKAAEEASHCRRVKSLVEGLVLKSGVAMKHLHDLTSMVPNIGSAIEKADANAQAAVKVVADDASTNRVIPAFVRPESRPQPLARLRGLDFTLAPRLLPIPAARSCRN